MSQRDLANQAGVRQALVSQIERGEANVTIDSLLKIAVALSVSLTDLLDGTPNQDPSRRNRD
ncbi:transcriptional regulator with XRE-family HTH domain [Bradyrhizobium sp. USDA 3364]